MFKNWECFIFGHVWSDWELITQEDGHDLIPIDIYCTRKCNRCGKEEDDFGDHNRSWGDHS